MVAVPSPEVGLALGLFLAGLGAGLYRSYRYGALRDMLDDKRQAGQAHRAIPEVVEKLDEVHASVQRVDEKVDVVGEKADRNAYLISEFHEGETVEVAVEDIHDDDFLRGGGNPTESGD